MKRQESIQDNYNLGQVLGQGGFGCIRFATHKKTGVRKAVKTIKKSTLQIQGALQEFEMLKDLDHPHILRVNELYEDDRNFHMVTELCEGQDLFERIQLSGVFSENHAAMYINQILSGIYYCHRRNIIHKDLKPENVMFNDSSPEGVLKIIDFGLAQYDVNGIEYNTSGSVIYKQKYYTAPEVFQLKYDCKCDIWSCGVILYILLCGYPPFNGRDLFEVQSNICNQSLSFPNPEWCYVSKGAKSFIQKLLQKEPQARPTAHEAIMNRWLRKNSIQRGKVRKLRSNCLQNLIEFRVNFKQSICKLRHAALSYIATHLTTKDDLKELLQIFQSLDIDNDGSLSKEEIQSVSHRFNLSIPIDVDQVIQQCDSNGNGTIEYSEFITAAINWQQNLSMERLESAFRAFDIDGNGSIDLAEIQMLLGSQKGGNNQKQWMKIMEEADLDGDSVISLDEFKVLVLKV